MNAELRVIKTPAEQGLADAYASAKAMLPGKGAIASLREDAFKRFETQGLPNRRVEEWKYTDLRALMREILPLANTAAPPAKVKTHFDQLKGCRLVFVDGAFDSKQSDAAAQSGVTVTPMAKALAEGNALLGAHMGKVFETKDPAVALNTALMGDGALIHIAANTKVAEPIILIFAGTQAASVFTRSLIVVEPGAGVTLAEIHKSNDTQANNALELVVGDRAQVEHVKITEAKALHLSTLMASVGAKARFRTFALTANSAVVRNQAFLHFKGNDTEAAIGGVSLLNGKQHVDTTLVIRHDALRCSSRERFRSVVDGESRTVFQGKIIVEPGAQKTDAKMVSNALLLSDQAEADNKPELEIFADDVQCGHGATAGALDEQLLFYLRARGIPRKEAEALMIQAFVGETVETIANEQLRELVMLRAIAWLEARG
jgi:Fe-S cluster assembly protein SufD